MHDPIAPQAFLDTWQTLLSAGPSGLVAQARLLLIDSSRAPWQPSGLRLTAGDEVSWFAHGESVLTPLPTIRVGASLQIWGRLGNADIFRGVRDSHTFRAGADGELELGTYFPGEWRSPAGELAVPPETYGAVQGSFGVVLLRWAAGVSPVEGMQRLLAHGNPAGSLSREIDGLRHPVAPPAGWSYHWAPGPAEIYRAQPADGSCIDCHTRADVGILRHDAPYALTPGTTLDWEWRMDCLPSALAEDTLPTHDYLSIAVEFDNGRDLSYFWSAALPVGHHFHCPIPTWTHRETHLVVRSGQDGFGRWQRERRDLHADYVRCIGEPPARIERVWLIAVSLFQQQEGRCSYRRMALDGAGPRLEVGSGA